jgi:pimeloyl-ACP methyl ester carboxylesterase
MPDHVKEEFQGLEESEQEAPEPAELGEIPITVIAATEPPIYASKELQELWLSVQQDFADDVANGRYVQANGASHYVHKDRPDLVIREIRDVVERIRSGG